MQHSMSATKVLSGLTTLLLALILTACGTQQQQPQRQPEEPGQYREPSISHHRTEAPSQSSAVDLTTIQTQLETGQWLLAQRLVDGIDASQLPARNQVELALLQARIAYRSGDIKTANNTLAAIESTAVDPEQKLRIIALRRLLLRDAGHYLDSARLSPHLLPSNAPRQQSQRIAQDVWRDLGAVNPDTLAQALKTATDPHWRAWLELALIDSKRSTDITAINRSFATWQSRYRDHLAADLPGGLQRLANWTPLTKVSLMLPLSGPLAPAAKAVRDGYLASYYRSHRGQAQAPELDIIDTHGTQDIRSAYRDAVASGSQLIIGPLSKNLVIELAQQADRPVPVIALNRVDKEVDQSFAPLLQLSLAPEDEVTQVARLGYGKGIRRALIIHPAGSWGNKLAQLLDKRWQQLGGVAVSTAAYSSQDNISDSIKKALAIASSEARATQMRRLLGTDITSLPRRRQDLDGVFLLARTPQEARSIKPLLAFHFAGDLPIFATSSIYGGEVDRRDRDLEGVMLVEIPWIMAKGQSLRSNVQEALTTPASFARLNALGADAHLLQTRMQQLEPGTSTIIRGSTGLLSVGPNLRVQRRLLPASFDGGKLRQGL